MNELYYISVALIFAMFFTQIAKIFKLPNVTAYLVGGLVAGPYCLNLLSSNMTMEMTVLVDVALGFIAFSIGSEFKISHIKKIGAKVILITVFESLGAVLLVDTVLIFVGFNKAAAITLGAMSASTAPAATLLVVRQFKAKGPVTDNLLPVVALDDAVGLIMYSLSVAVARIMISGFGDSVVTMVFTPLKTIFGSLTIGGLYGVILALLFNIFSEKNNRLILCILAVVAGICTSNALELSSLLFCMALGATFVNLNKDGVDMLSKVDDWTPPIFAMFFVISGAELNLNVLPQIGVIGFVYIICRVVGKYIGVYTSCTIVKAHPKVRKYLGIALIPQAGVAIGMAQSAIKQLPEYGIIIQTVILSGTLVYELIGPLCAKIALKAAGEIEE